MFSSMCAIPSYVSKARVLLAFAITPNDDCKINVDQQPTKISLQGTAKTIDKL